MKAVIKIIAIVFIVSICFMGCSAKYYDEYFMGDPLQLYNGEKLSQDKISRLVYQCGVVIHQIDGQQIEYKSLLTRGIALTCNDDDGTNYNARIIELNPGKHTITFDYRRQIYHGSYVEKEKARGFSLEYNFEPGKKYRIIVVKDVDAGVAIAKIVEVDETP
jgi:hypothetical protein